LRVIEQVVRLDPDIELDSHREIHTLHQYVAGIRIGGDLGHDSRMRPKSSWWHRPAARDIPRLPVELHGVALTSKAEFRAAALRRRLFSGSPHARRPVPECLPGHFQQQ
jgi:hypothetical protein